MVRVLVAEDNPLNMELVQEILTSIGFTVFGAVNGKEAVAMTEDGSYDLILMDIELPVMDGISAVKIIKSRPQYKNVPVLALTAFAMKGDRERFLAEGFDDYIPKPIDMPDFMKKMEKFMGMKK